MSNLAFSFDQIKLSKNENVNNSVLNRPLARLYTMIRDLSLEKNIPISDHQEITFLSDIYNEDGSHTVQWQTAGTLTDILEKPRLQQLSNVSQSLPITGQTINWNEGSKKWEFKKLPDKINDLNNFELVDENPVDKSVMTWNTQLNSWVAQTVTKYIGVGYIYHQICSRPTVVTLPTSKTALSGGEQIVITKLKPNNADANSRYPILITVGDDSATIIGRRSIWTNSENEDWASIHLRSVVAPDGKYMWVPVAGNGTWKPTEKIDLTNEDSGNRPIDRPPALTENQIKLQPYNIDIGFKIENNDISKSYDVTFIRSSGAGDWKLDSTKTSDFVYYSIDSGILTVNHNILDGLRLVKTIVYVVNGNKLCQITPNEVYFDIAQASQYAAVNIDLHEWLDNINSNEIKFKVLISI